MDVPLQRDGHPEANTEAQQYTTCIDTCGSYSDSPQCRGDGSRRRFVTRAAASQTLPVRPGNHLQHREGYAGGMDPRPHWTAPNCSRWLRSSTRTRLTPSPISRAFICKAANGLTCPRCTPPRQMGSTWRLCPTQHFSGYCTDIYDAGTAVVATATPCRVHCAIRR